MRHTRQPHVTEGYDVQVDFRLQVTCFRTSSARSDPTSTPMWEGAWLCGHRGRGGTHIQGGTGRTRRASLKHWWDPGTHPRPQRQGWKAHRIPKDKAERGLSRCNFPEEESSRNSGPAGTGTVTISIHTVPSLLNSSFLQGGECIPRGPNGTFAPRGNKMGVVGNRNKVHSGCKQ